MINSLLIDHYFLKMKIIIFLLIYRNNKHLNPNIFVNNPKIMHKDSKVILNINYIIKIISFMITNSVI